MFYSFLYNIILICVYTYATKLCNLFEGCLYIWVINCTFHCLKLSHVILVENFKLPRNVLFFIILKKSPPSSKEQVDKREISTFLCLHILKLIFIAINTNIFKITQVFGGFFILDSTLTAF